MYDGFLKVECYCTDDEITLFLRLFYQPCSPSSFTFVKAKNVCVSKIRFNEAYKYFK